MEQPTNNNRIRQSIQISRLKRLRYGLAVGFFIGLLTYGIWAAGFFTTLRLRLNNAQHVNRPTTGNVVIVGIDNRALTTYGRISDWSRALHADIVEILAEENARVIVFDILFSEPSVNLSQDDEFAIALQQFRRGTPRIVMAIAGDRQFSEVTPDKITFVTFSRPLPKFEENAHNVGFVNISPDIDGVLRWQPMRATEADSERTEVSLAAATYLSYLGISGNLRDQVIENKPGEMLLFGEHRVPLDEQGRMLITYFGRPESDDSFKIYSFQEVLEGNFPPGAFEDKIVLIGVINATGLTDVYPVPLGLEDQTMAGVAIHANIIETMVQQLYFREQSALSQVLLIFGLALIVTVLLTQLRWRAIIVLTPVLVVIWLVAALTYGNVYHVVMNLFDPMVAIALPLPAALAVNIYLETQRREWTEILLNSAVSASQHQLDLNSLYETIASDIQTLIPCEAVQIHTWNNLTNTTELVYQTPPEVSDISWAPGLIQQALKNKHLAARPEGVALPLFWQDKPQAVIFIYANEGMNETRRRILNLFAWQTSSILANAELYQQTQQLSELKTRMIRMASHDLKNPIGAVIGYTELLLEDQTYEPFLSEEQDRYLQAIMTSANQMERIVRDILNIERVRSGQIQNEPFSLLKVMENCLTVFKMEAERNQQKLHSELPKEFPMLMGDQGQLYEAVSNLVSNALKYTPPNGNITVELSKSDKFAKVMVADDGPGIPLQAQAQLFQEFYRVKTEATAHVSGTGLGLSLVKSVVEAHKGHVWVESDVGKGSKFFIELPLNEAIPIPVEA